MTTLLAWLSLAVGLDGSCEALLRLSREAAHDFASHAGRSVVVFTKDQLPEAPEGQPPILIGGLSAEDGRVTALLLAPGDAGAQEAWEHTLASCLEGPGEGSGWVRDEEREIPVLKEAGVFPDAAYMRELHLPRGIYWTDPETTVRIELIEEPSILLDLAERLGLETRPAVAIRIGRIAGP